MTANQSAKQATLNGSPDALRPTTFDSGISFSTRDHDYQRVTPEFQKQVESQLDAMYVWLQFKAKNAIVKELFPPVTDSEGTVIPGQIADIDNDTIRDQIIIPEMHARQAESLEFTVDVIQNRIPNIQDELADTYDQYLAAEMELNAIEEEMNKENPSSYIASQYGRAKRSFKGAKITIENLEGDIPNLTTRARNAEAVFIHIKDALNNKEALDEKVGKIVHEAKIDAYLETIELKEAEKNSIQGSSKGEIEKIQHLAYQISALRVELTAIIDLGIVTKEEIRVSEAKPVEAEVSKEAETSFDKPVLSRILGNLSLKGAYFTKVAHR